MSDVKGPQPGTPQRVLDSALEVFAERGFRDATVHEICQRAGANIAAVNYYFGSKENLYAEAWRKAFHDSLEAHPPDGGVPQDASPEERLRGRVRALIHGAADEDNHSFLIMQKEMAEPTRLLKEVTRECIRPLHEQTAALVRELLGGHATEQQVRFCEASVLSQCLDVVRRMRMHRERPATEDRPLVIDDVDAYAEHVAQFSLAGIRAMREQVEKKGTDV